MSPHGLLKAGRRFFHLLARPRLAADARSAGADAQHAAACVLKLYGRDDEVGSTYFRSERGADFRHQSRAIVVQRAP